MDSVSLQIDNLKEIERLLGSMDKVLARKPVRVAARAAQKIVHRSIVSHINALSASGRPGPSLRARMAKSLSIRAARKNPPGTYRMDVRFKNPEQYGLVYYPKGSSTSLSTGKTSGRRTFVPFALEYGHGSSKEAAARPFMRPGITAAEPTAERELNSVLWRELEQACKLTSGRAAG